MNGSELAEPTPLQHAPDEFVTAFGHLVKVVDDGALDDLDAAGLVGFLQEFEAIRNQFPVVDHRVIQSAIGRDLPHTLCRRSMVQVFDAGVAVVPG
jgi:hypothetical protein